MFFLFFSVDFSLVDFGAAPSLCRQFVRVDLRVRVVNSTLSALGPQRALKVTNLDLIVANLTHTHSINSRHRHVCLGCCVCV